MTVMPTVRLFYGLITIPKTSTYFNYNYLKRASLSIYCRLVSCNGNII